MAWLTDTFELIDTCPAPVVARVRITSGEAILDTRSADLSSGGQKDLVVMDDWIYGEPQLAQ